MLSLNITEAKLMELSNNNFFDPEELCKNTHSYAVCIACFFNDSRKGSFTDEQIVSGIEDWLLNGIQSGNSNRTIRAMLNDYIDSIYS